MIYDELLIRSKNKISMYIELLNNINSNPELILESLFNNGENNILTFVMKNPSEFMRSEEIDIFQFQEYLYSNLISFLKNKYDEYSFGYKVKEYPALLYIYYKDEIIAGINIYDKKLYIIEKDEIINIRKKIKENEMKINEIKEDIKELEKYSDNLFLMATNPIKMIDVAIRKKKYKEDIMTNFNKSLEAKSEIQRIIDSDEIYLKKLLDDNVEVEVRQNQIARYFEERFHYGIVYPITKDY